MGMFVSSWNSAISPKTVIIVEATSLLLFLLRTLLSVATLLLLLAGGGQNKQADRQLKNLQSPVHGLFALPFGFPFNNDVRRIRSVAAASTLICHKTQYATSMFRVWGLVLALATLLKRCNAKP